MVMRVTILQPSYLPWLGFFEQMSRSDKFVLLDDVQYTRRDWRNRNRVRVNEGWAWLTVPVLQKSKFSQSLLETHIDNSVPWRKKHLETLRQHYSKSPFFEQYFSRCQKIYEKEWTFLFDLCLETIILLKEELGVETPLLRSSQMEISGQKTERLLSICRELGATHYLSGEAASDYILEANFSSQGIELEYQKYDHPVYPQRYPGFVPQLSAIDLLFNCGEQSLSILKQNAESGSRCS
ncbi:MAG: WbqC family protein [Nitrospinae bacterium]|nr:WbqC family protein [Nitrospinota bacterium]MBL7019496.1 WbqC family protein [Nitrospinaceae bacterium]